MSEANVYIVFYITDDTCCTVASHESFEGVYSSLEAAKAGTPDNLHKPQPLGASGY